MDEAVASFVARFHSIGLDGVPLSADQVEALEGHYKLPFPAAYKAYLLIAGASPPSRLIGSDCHGACLYQMRDWANKLIEEAARPFALSADAVVFLMHQGYQFFFFQADGKSDDPEVFYFIEGAPAETLPVSKFERFSGWVEAIA